MKIENDWSKLSQPSKTILERVGINKKDLTLAIGEELDIPYFKGIITEEIVEEICNFQFSKVNEGYFSTIKKDNKLTIVFLKQAIDDI